MTSSAITAFTAANAGIESARDMGEGRYEAKSAAPSSAASSSMATPRWEGDKCRGQFQEDDDRAQSALYDE